MVVEPVASLGVERGLKKAHMRFGVVRVPPLFLIRDRRVRERRVKLRDERTRLFGVRRGLKLVKRCSRNVGLRAPELSSYVRRFKRARVGFD